MDKPIKKTNYTKFDNMEDANDYARSSEKDLNNLFQYTGQCPQVYRGAVVPTLTPKAVGDIYVNTTTAKVYIATGVVSSSSWALLN